MNRTINILEHSPPVLREIQEYKIISEIINTELNLLNATIDDVLNQNFIDSATWGLGLWENRYNIENDLSKSYDERRAVINAKRRGYGTVTKRMLQETAEAFSGGDVEIIEHPEKYSFTVKFVGVKGIPQNMQDFKSVIDDIKPAHLSVSYEFTYTIWKELSNKNWNSLNLSWNDLRIRKWT